MGTDRGDGGQPVRWLLGAAGVSSLGDGMAVVALPLLAIRLTTDPRLIAGLLVAERLPWLGLSLPAGVLADRFPRLRLMRMAEVVRAVVLLIAAAGSLTGHLTIPTLYLLAVALGAADTVFSTAGQAAMADLVPLDGLDRANGRLFSTQTSGEQLIGPALGGLVFAVSASAPLLIDGFSFVASALLLARVSPIRGLAVEPPAHSPPDDEREPAMSVGAGLRAFAATPVLRVLLVLLSGLGLCQAMVVALLVVYATRTLHLGAAEYGMFCAAGSIGCVAGGFAVTSIRSRFGTAMVMTTAAVAAASAYLILAGTSSALVAVAAFIVESFAVACGCVASLTVRQSSVPPELRGRIASIFRMAIYGAVPLGALSGGVLAAVGGLRLPFVVAGIMQLGLAAATAGPLKHRLPHSATAGPRVLPVAAVPA